MMLVDASTACVLLVIGSIAFAGLRLPTRSVPPRFAPAAGAPNASVGLADEPEQCADRPCPKAEHRRSADELLAVELSCDELVDHVVLDGSRRGMAVLLDSPTGLAIHSLPS